MIESKRKVSDTMQTTVLQVPIDEELREEADNLSNAETIAAIEEAERISGDPNVKGYTDIDEMFKKLLADDLSR